MKNVAQGRRYKPVPLAPDQESGRSYGMEVAANVLGEQLI